jgi:hypothetical protein
LSERTFIDREREEEGGRGKSLAAEAASIPTRVPIAAAKHVFGGSENADVWFCRDNRG